MALSEEHHENLITSFQLATILPEENITSCKPYYASGGTDGFSFV
jgi:hypothetical protein